LGLRVSGIFQAFLPYGKQACACIYTSYRASCRQQNTLSGNTEVFVEILSQLSPAGAKSSNHQYPAGMTTEGRKFNHSGGGGIIPSDTGLWNWHRKQLLPPQVSKSHCSNCYLQILSTTVASVTASTRYRIKTKVKCIRLEIFVAVTTKNVVF
jgi:hypothetical protein